ENADEIINNSAGDDEAEGATAEDLALRLVLCRLLTISLGRRRPTRAIWDRLVRESSGLNPAAEDAEDSGNLIVQLGANRHSVAQRIEANLTKRGSAAAQALLDDVQTATESERNLYAMLTPAELLSCGSSNSAAGPADVVSDFGLPVSLMRCLLEVPPLQAGLAEMLAELLVAIDKSDYPVCLQAASRIEAILFDIIEASSLDAKRDTIALLPELFTQATDSLCEKLRSLLVSATELDDTSGSHGNASSTPLTPALFDSNRNWANFRLAMQLLASVRSCLSIPVLLRFLLDNPPSEPDAVIEFLMEIRSRLDMFAVPVLEQQKQQTQVQQHATAGRHGRSWASLNISGIQPMAPNAASSAANLAASAAATETAESLVCELVQRKLAAKSGGGGSSRNSRRRRQAVLRLCRSLIRNRACRPGAAPTFAVITRVLARRMAEQLVDLLDRWAELGSGSQLRHVWLPVSALAAEPGRLPAEPSWLRARSPRCKCLVDVATLGQLSWPVSPLCSVRRWTCCQLGPGQARLLYSALARLAYRGCGGGRQALQDDLCILVRKQLWHSRPMYQ
uniref:DUF3453 domain-containing protein n=1 Tax=Macrostomum lignano TaxID=282301 RepID=A0A1I8FG43_9PLAT